MKHTATILNRRGFSLILALLLLGGGIAAAQVGMSAEDALAAGNATALSQLFNSTVEIRILDEENVYAKQQAAVVLDSFFRKYTPSGFSVQHRNNRDNNSFLIGTLRCQSESFRVSLFMKGTGDSQRITQITIAKATNF